MLLTYNVRSCLDVCIPSTVGVGVDGSWCGQVVDAVRAPLDARRERGQARDPRHCHRRRVACEGQLQLLGSRRGQAARHRAERQQRTDLRWVVEACEYHHQHMHTYIYTQTSRHTHTYTHICDTLRKHDRQHMCMSMMLVTCPHELIQ